MGRGEVPDDLKPQTRLSFVWLCSVYYALAIQPRRKRHRRVCGRQLMGYIASRVVLYDIFAATLVHEDILYCYVGAVSILIDCSRESIPLSLGFTITRVQGLGWLNVGQLVRQLLGQLVGQLVGQLLGQLLGQCRVSGSMRISEPP